MIYTITIVGWEDDDEDNNGSIEDSNHPTIIDVEGGGEKVDEAL